MFTPEEWAVLDSLPKPINWDDMGSSSKDLWCERQLRSIRKAEGVTV